MEIVDCFLDSSGNHTGNLKILKMKTSCSRRFLKPTEICKR